jgi:AcrR family transcriptional regulator
MTAQPPMAQPVTDRGWRTRARLLQAARMVFEERGFAGTRMQDVAATAEVSHGTVYTWFPAKEELLRALVAELREQQASGAGDPGTDAERPTPYVRLRSANERFLSSYAANARMLSVIEEAASADPSWLVVLEELREVYVDRTMRALRRWQEAGVVAADLDAAQTAVALTGMVETFARRAVAMQTSVPLDDAAELITRLWAGAVGIPVPAPASTSPSMPAVGDPSPSTPSQPITRSAS